MVWFSNEAVIGGRAAVNKERQSQQNLLLIIIIDIMTIMIHDGADEVDNALY